MYDATNFRLDNQVAVITGAGSGIGRAIAETFASAGAAVIVSDRDDEAADTVAAVIEANGGKAAAVVCDVTKEDDLAQLVKQAIKRFGKLTILVSYAGGGVQELD